MLGSERSSRVRISKTAVPILSDFKVRVAAPVLFCLVAFGFDVPKEESRQRPSLDVSKASPYRVLGKETWNFMSAERSAVFTVVSGAADFEGCAQTATSPNIGRYIMSKCYSGL